MEVANETGRPSRGVGDLISGQRKGQEPKDLMQCHRRRSPSQAMEYTEEELGKGADRPSTQLFHFWASTT